jgi:predicted RNase H-like nuclease
MKVVGVDACRGGWVGVVLRDGAFAGSVVAVGCADLLAAVSEARVVAVDIPIGLLEAGWRRADAAARRVLGARAATVFAIPPRPVVEAPTYQEANRRCRTLTGRGLSRQAWALVPRILDVERCHDATGRDLWEVHPEVSFRDLAGRPLDAAKRTAVGQAARRALLAGAGITLPAGLLASRLAAAHDVLDAAVVAWSAARIAAGTAASLPDPPERDRGGRPIAIWH